ncbi:MAG: hypothetical protein IPL16_14140 [Ignavibacteria bacterium]|nr:hypothetical protein [Ignavibacteria bacterium]
MKSKLEILINRKISRRKMLKDAGKASAFLASCSCLQSFLKFHCKRENEY